MSNSERSRALIDSAMELFDQADDIERRARDGEEVFINNQRLRGEALTPLVEQVRVSVRLPLLASLTISMERAAAALEKLAEADQNFERPLRDYSTAELSAELAERLQAQEDPASRHR